MCRRQRAAPPQPGGPPVPLVPVGKVFTEQPPPPPQLRPRQLPLFTVYDEIGETENQKNNVYERTNFKPDVTRFQPYQRLDEATMESR